MTIQTSFVVTFTHDESITFHAGLISDAITEVVDEAITVGICVQDANEYFAVKVDQAIDTANILANAVAERRYKYDAENCKNCYDSGFSEGSAITRRQVASIVAYVSGTSDVTPWN